MPDPDDLPRVLYHGTSALRVDRDISGDGLRPQRAAPGVYLTDSLQHAWGYADCAVDMDSYQNEDEGTENVPVILVVDTAALDPTSFGPDDHELDTAIRKGDDPLLTGHGSWKDVPWHLSLAACEQVTYAERIPWAVVQVARSVEEAREIGSAILDPGPRPSAGPRP